MQLLSEYKTPAHVVRHCIAVTEVALAVAGALNEHGYSLDLDLIRSAGLIHDIARVQEQHWEVGARVAEELGLQEEADIIRRHMFYAPCRRAADATELDLVCLGDRLVKEDRYVGLESRMQYILEKARAAGNEGAEAAIRLKTANLQELIEDIENTIAMPIDALVKEKSTE